MAKLDLCTLAQCLKQERLFVSSEKKLIQQLGRNVLKAAEMLHQAAWITREKKEILEQLGLTGTKTPPAECCQRARLLEDTSFVDAHKVLGHHEGAYGEFLCRLRVNPSLVASCLVAGWHMSCEHAFTATHTVFASIYGSCVTHEDEAHVLQVLQNLAQLELAESDDVRRLLACRSSSFGLLFCLFSSCLHAARLFLTAALHEPVMQLLVQDEDHLETDPLRLAEQLASVQRAHSPPGPGMPTERARAAAEANEVKLAALVGRFVDGLRRNTYCFPLELRWVMTQVHQALLPRVGPDEARAVCAHLLFACFICPTIVSPEQYGIVSEAPINEAARFNLKQVSRLLQLLATGELDEVYPPWKSVLLKFDKGGVVDFLDAVIGGSVEQAPPTPSLDLLEGLTRTAVYMTCNQLYTLVEFVRDVASGVHLPEVDQLTLEAFLSDVPMPMSRPGSTTSLKRSASTTALVPGPTGKKNSLPLSTQATGRAALGSTLSRSIMALDSDLDTGSQDNLQEVTAEVVLVITLGNAVQTVPGMMSENEVLAMNLGDLEQGKVTPEDGSANSQPAALPPLSCSGDSVQSMCEVQSNQSESSVELEEESDSGAASLSASGGAEAPQLLDCQHENMQDTLNDRLCEFVLTDMPDLSESQSCDVLPSNLELSLNDEGLSEVAGATVEPLPPSPCLLLNSKSCLLDSCAGSIVSEPASDTWSMDVLASDTEAPDMKHEEQTEEVDSALWGESPRDSMEVREVSSRPSSPEIDEVLVGCRTSEDSEDKAEDHHLEYSFEMTEKEPETRPDTEDPNGTGVRPKGTCMCLLDPCPDPTVPCLTGLTQAELDQAKQRHSMPEQLGKRDRDDTACPTRRPFSDPGLHRRVVLDSRCCSTKPPGGASSLKRSSKGEAEEKKEGEDEKTERSRPWWKKHLPLSKASKGAFRKKAKHNKEEMATEQQRLEAPPNLAEDILDKYRHIKRTSCGESEQQCSPSESIMEPGQTLDCPREDVSPDAATEDQVQPYPLEAPAPGSQFSFSDAKKKLRLALCSADSVSFPIMPSDPTPNGFPDGTQPGGNEVIYFLKVQLAEAINLQDKNRIAQIQETLRCVCRYDAQECDRLLAAIAEDYRKRAPYVAYLTRCRQGLQASQDYLERQLQRVLRDKVLASQCLTATCVRLLLERLEDKMCSFVKAFQGFTAADDKTAAVEDFLRDLYGVMSHDATWQRASEEQLQEAQTAIERTVMSRIFKLAFYPNLDGDTLRDQVLQEHIQRLSKVVNANHEALQIPQVYLKEAPWPAAQAEIRCLSAYKTPRDKVQCVTRMCSSIMNLLSLANEDSVPGADDFLPVLVFVLIKANPPCLLSTIQYISSFYGSRLSGEESYWWMQFEAAVEFIKTIDDQK